MNNNVLISGGSGLVGSAIVKLLSEKGYNVAILSRKQDIEGIKSFYWDYEKSILDKEAIEFADIIIHLAGENISVKRWTKKQKQKIIDSRVQTTNLLCTIIEKAIKKPHTIISASAIGYYGTYTSEKIFVEEDEAGSDFLAKTVESWENSIDRFNQLGIRTVKLRIGVVLSKDGGALPKILRPVKLGLAASFGKGNQYFPWIEIKDLARMFLFVIENKTINTAYNAVAPNYISYKELIGILAKSFNKPYFSPNIPAFLLKLFMGEMSCIILYGSRVSGQKIQEEGFEFESKRIEDVIKFIEHSN